MLHSALICETGGTDGLRVASGADGLEDMVRWIIEHQIYKQVL